MAENKEELSIEEMFDRLDGIMRTLEDSRSTLKNRLRRMRRECVWSALAVKR